MQASVVIVRDVLHPSSHRDIRVETRPRRIQDLAPITAQPVICIRNGKYLLRKDWHRRLHDRDTLCFVQLPQGGGGGSNPMKMVLLIAMSLAAPGIANALYGAIAEAGAGAWLTASGMSMLTGVVGFVGTALINTLIPAPKPTTPQTASSLASASPTYSLQAQGNVARLDEAIPVIYGRHLVYPNFGAMPYTEYSGNDQYLYQLLVIGQGEHEIEAIRIEDTPVSNFDDITYQVVNPGEAVTLFPAQVITSVEVSGQKAEYNTALGGYVANPPGTETNSLGVDVVFPRGLFYANDSGGLTEMSVSWKVETRALDEVGAPTGAWFVLGNESITAATATPQRRSYRYNVPRGRYELRLTRTNAEDTSSRAGHELNWAGLRAYIPGSQYYGNITLVAMRMKATDNLSSQSSRKVNMIVTRKLRTWSPETGWSAETVPTRAVAWAWWDACTAAYGAVLPASRLMAPADLYALHQVWESRGDKFNVVFDSQLGFWEALTHIARAGRALPYQQGGMVRMFRDQPATLPVAMFTPRNIVKGSFGIKYLMPTEETVDALDVRYFDQTVWGWRTVTAKLPGSTASKRGKVTLTGVTDRAQAWREGMYMAACNRYRRRHPGLTTEMEGFIPAPGDLAAISHDMPKWGQYAEAVAWDEATRTLTLSEPMDWSAGGPHCIALRRRNGSASGPWTVTAGTNAHQVVLAEEPDITPDVGQDRERTHTSFGPSNACYLQVRILSLKPKSRTEVTLAAVVESDAVHTADTGEPPPETAWQLPGQVTRPMISGLTARSMPDAPDKMLCSWDPSPNASSYLIEQSEDGQNWTRCGDTTANNYTALAIYGPRTIVRVAAVGLARGPWVEIAYGQTASYMWTGTDSDLMWEGSDNDIMWNY